MSRPDKRYTHGIHVSENAIRYVEDNYRTPPDTYGNSQKDHQEKYKRYSRFRDYGPAPFVVNIEEATKINNTFRTALWTGTHLQLTLMSIDAGEDIGLENHPDVDQFIRIEEGHGLIMMGQRKDRLNYRTAVYDDDAILIPAGTWHNLVNTGHKPLKLYSIYAPPEHPRGTVHETKADAQSAESFYD